MDNVASQGRSPNAATSPDTFTGQMIHLDELIKSARELLSRTQKIADSLCPNTEPTVAGDGGKLGRIEASPDSGPLLFRLQNRNQELHRIFSEIFSVQNRIDRSL